MVLEQALGKIGLKPAFSTKFKEAVPKTEVLEQPQLLIVPFYHKFSKSKPAGRLIETPERRQQTKRLSAASERANKFAAQLR
jgi:hypothetical protein